MGCGASASARTEKAKIKRRRRFELLAADMLQAAGIADGSREDWRICRHEFEALIEKPGFVRFLQEVGLENSNMDRFVLGLQKSAHDVFKYRAELSFCEYVDFIMSRQERGLQETTAMNASQSDYQDPDSLNNLLRGGDCAPVVLIEMAYLHDLRKRGGIIPCRQDLPSEAKYNWELDGVQELVVSLSYCWCTKEHPDPQGKVLADLSVFVSFLDEIGKLENQTIIAFWDYISLYQNTMTHQRSAPQLASFKAGLQGVNILYAHAKVWVLLCTKAYRELSYMDSGWPTFEWCTSQLIKPVDLTIDAPAALDFIKSRRKDKTHMQLCTASARSTRRLPLTPECFATEIANKTVANGADIDLLRKKYAQTFEAVVVPTSTFDFRNMVRENTNSWSAFLCTTLLTCNNLRNLNLSDNEELACALKAFQGLTHLLTLDLACTGVRGQLTPISELSDLEFLKLAGCVHLEGTLASLSRLAMLCSLDIEGCWGLEGFNSLADLKLLSLNIYDTKAEDESKLARLLGATCVLGRNGVAMVLTAQSNPDHDHTFYSPVQRAAVHGQVNMMKWLLAAGCKIEPDGIVGKSALYLASEEGHVDIVRELLEHKVDASADYGFGEYDRSGWHPLPITAEMGIEDICKLLVANASKVPPEEKESCETATVFEVALTKKAEPKEVATPLADETATKAKHVPGSGVFVDASAMKAKLREEVAMEAKLPARKTLGHSDC